MKIPKYYYFRVRVINKGTSIEVEDASDADVVEVVRCNDCIYQAECAFTEWLGRNGNGFCSCGERKQERMNYCVNCLNYDYCSARGICINPPFGYCTRYQPKSWCEVKMDEVTNGDN
jgi:hypothetical protein